MFNNQDLHDIDTILVGDHIAAINGKDVVGSRHFEVAKILRELPEVSEFTLLLHEPIRSGFGKLLPLNHQEKQNMLYLKYIK